MRDTIAMARVGAVLAALAAIAALFAGIGPASAGGSCTINGNGVSQIELDDTGDPTVIRVDDGELFVDGVSCGPVQYVFIQDNGAVSADHVIIDLRSPFRVDGRPIILQNNMRGPLGEDVIEFRGPNGDDIVTMRADGGVAFQRPTNFAGGDNVRFTMFAASFQPHYIINLRGGDDTFTMLENPIGGTYSGRVTVNGGKGDDELRGAAGRQDFYGGKGNDLLQGKQGRDRLYGQSGRDEISGGKANDRIVGGSGRDNVRGGTGSDDFRMADGSVDTVRFGPGANDVCDCDPEDILE